MHHLSVNTGGGGGRQVNGSPPGCLLLTVLSVFNYAFRGVSVSVSTQTCGVAGAPVSFCHRLLRFVFLIIYLF